MRPMDRRRALGLVAAGALRSRLGAADQLRFFDERENRILDRLAETILPADDHSPGAHEAGVSQYLDLVAANSASGDQTAWKSGIAALDRLAQAKLGKPFLELKAGELAGLVGALAAHEQNPATTEERFFARVKQATLFAYYTSEVGLRKELGYLGNDALAEFPGCSPGVEKKP